MNKIKVLAISLVISIMLMGVGYAAWTSTSNVTTNASTGNFSVSIEPDISGKVTYKSDDTFSDYTKDNIYATVDYGTPSNSSDSAGATIINFNNLYPGSTAIGSIKVTNNSSLPIKYGLVAYSISDMSEKNLFSGGLVKVYAEINGEPFTLDKTSGDIQPSVGKEIRVKSGENIDYIKIKVVVSKNLTDNLGSGLQIQLTPSFKQYNS